MKYKITIGLMFFSILNFGAVIHADEKRATDNLLTPEVRSQILEKSSADAIQKIDTVVFRNMGNDAIMVVVCSLDIRSVENKVIDEAVMHSTFTFISRAGGKMKWVKWRYSPFDILKGDFRIPAE